MKDPYEVLGINKNATEDEIKAAYKEQARKYHPDNYTNNPLSDLAEERMKEINEAYDSIMSKKRNKSKGGFNGYSGSSEFADIRSMILANRLEEAQELLDGVDISRRSAEWYFLNGSVLYRRGWFDDSFASFSTACRMDPTNPEYRAAYDRMSHQRAGGFSNGGYRTYNSAGGCSSCDVCSGLICADCCCECLGGDLISCC